MATTASEAGPRRSRRHGRTDATDETVVSAASDGVPGLLALVADEYARTVLTLLAERPATGRELADASGASRSTVYRRLDRLEDAGLVRTERRVDPDGHHCKEFHLARDRLWVAVGDGEVVVRARASSDGGET